MVDQTNYVKQPKTELKQHYDQMTNQRQDLYNPEAVHCKYLDKLSMRWFPNEDPCFQEQSRQWKEKPKLEEMGKL